MMPKAQTENCNLQNAKTQLSALLAELGEKRANPFKGSALEALTDEIRALRQVYRLSYREIADKLTALKVETDEDEVRTFFRLILKPRGRKSRRRGRTASGR